MISPLSGGGLKFHVHFNIATRKPRRQPRKNEFKEKKDKTADSDLVSGSIKYNLCII